MTTHNIVLVHGGFVDGSGWRGVYDILKRDGYNVTIVQNPTTSLAADVAATRTAIAAQDGPVVLVGHSYGGVVITEAGTDPKVERLVYIAAFAPDAGELVQSLIANPPAGAPVPPILPPRDGFLFLACPPPHHRRRSPAIDDRGAPLPRHLRQSGRRLAIRRAPALCRLVGGANFVKAAWGLPGSSSGPLAGVFCISMRLIRPISVGN